MKKLFLIISVSLITTIISAQKSVDALFEKYAGKDGFVTVTINGNLLKLAAVFDDDMENKSIPENITQIRILAQEADNIKVDNFYDLAIKDIDLNLYEEFMQIKESDQDVRMLVRTEGDRFTEFLMIVGGKDNALIQIKGSMTLEEAKKFADHAKKDHGLNLIESHE
jgi:NADH:ubiquinone oxidoreductase subunit D